MKLYLGVAGSVVDSLNALPPPALVRPSQRIDPPFVRPSADTFKATLNPSPKPSAGSWPTRDTLFTEKPKNDSFLLALMAKILALKVILAAIVLFPLSLLAMLALGFPMHPLECMFSHILVNLFPSKTQPKSKT